MAEVINPRSGGANTDSRYGLSGDALRLAQINVEMFNLKKTIDSNKPGSTKYETALTKYNALKKEQSDLVDKGKAEIAAKKKAAANKAKAKAEEDLQRAEALGDEKRAEKARNDINKAEEAAEESGTKTDNQQKDIDADKTKNYTGTGTKDKPLELNGKAFSGTYKGKKYENGILVSAAPAAAAGGKGDVDGKDKADENKALWVSYLRTTFAALEDKGQKAEIDRLFKLATGPQQWDEKKFMEELKGTSWWQNTFPTLRSFFLESNDPRNKSTFAQKVTNNVDSIMVKLEALGITPKQVDPQTGRIIDNSDFVKGIALKAIQNNWDDDQLENYLSTQSNFLFTGGGTIGSYLDRVKSTAYLYGINIDANLEKAINTSLLDPLDGRDYNYWVNSMKQMALDAPQNKPFQESLKAGRSLYEVTSTYRNQMANLLEVDSTAITWDDLMGKVLDKESGNARTFADFTKALKQDPLWQYTRNAKETYSGMALDLAKMFGYAG